MPCQGCSERARTSGLGFVPIDRAERVFACPLDGAHIEIVVRGGITAQNLPLVKQYLAFVYDVLTPPEAAEGNPDGRD